MANDKDKKKKTGPWVNEEAVAQSEQYKEFGGYPGAETGPLGPELIKGDSEQVQAAERSADQWHKNWYDHPETRDKLRRQLGLDDGQITQAINHSLNASQTKVFPHQLQNNANYESGAHAITYRNEASLPHELAHATQLDDRLGEILLQEIGQPKDSSYLSKPGEAYGNFHEWRKFLGIEPGDWVTPEFLESRMIEKGLNDPNHPEFPQVQQLLQNWSLQDIAIGLDKIASATHDSERLERLNFTPSEDVISRPNTLYT